MNIRGVKQVRPRTFCKSRAFRAGYDDARKGKPPRFDIWGEWDVAYERGRQVACHARARGEGIREIPVRSKIAPDDLMWLKLLLLDMR